MAKAIAGGRKSHNPVRSGLEALGEPPRCCKIRRAEKYRACFPNHPFGRKWPCRLIFHFIQWPRDTGPLPEFLEPGEVIDFPSCCLAVRGWFLHLFIFQFLRL